MFDVETIRSGQVRRYGDSIHEYVIRSDWPADKIEKYCTTNVRKCTNKVDDGRAQFSGACSFPFGLASFYAFRKLGNNKYYYIVCQPYTG